MSDGESASGGHPLPSRGHRVDGSDRRLIDRIAVQLRLDHRHEGDHLSSRGHNDQSIDVNPRSRPHATGPRAGRRDPDLAIARILELGRRETSMDVAVLGEIRDGHEVVRALVGDGGSFGLTVGASMPIEDTYCHRLLEGRLGNIVPDARTEELVRDLPVTHIAQVGAYIGVPVTTLQARLYVLCCLAHEQRPSLSARDVLMLRGLADSIVSELAAANG